MGNLRYLLLSRKFWLTLIGLLATIFLTFTGRELLPDGISEQALADNIVQLITVLVIAIGVEDGLRGRQ